MTNPFIFSPLEDTTTSPNACLHQPPRQCRGKLFANSEKLVWCKLLLALQIFRRKPCVRGTSQHPRPDFFPAMERKYVIWIALSLQSFVRSTAADLFPADGLQCTKYFAGLRAWPTTHAAKLMVIGAASCSPVSIRSAMTRNARASA